MSLVQKVYKTPGYIPRRSPEQVRRDEKFEAGLAVLEDFAARRPGVRLSQRTIAHACGVSQQCIDYLEKRAIRKLQRLRRPGISKSELIRPLHVLL